MKKIIVLSLVAILIAAGAGWAFGPGYVSIVTSFNNTGAGVAGVNSNTAINGFGTVDLSTGANGYASDSKITVYEKVELGDPGCWQCASTELDKTVSMTWKKVNPLEGYPLGSESTVINGWMTDSSSWVGSGTGSFYKNIEVDKFSW